MVPGLVDVLASLALGANGATSDAKGNPDSRGGQAQATSGSPAQDAPGEPTTLSPFAQFIAKTAAHQRRGDGSDRAIQQPATPASEAVAVKHVHQSSFSLNRDNSSPYAGEEPPAATRLSDRRDACSQALRKARAVIAAGGIVAVKGIGGFHLVVDAANEQAVSRLRRLKQRPHKPLAVMVTDIQAAEKLVVLNENTAGLIASPARPIVVAPLVADAPLAPSIAPGLSECGVMIAYSPLHQMLCDTPIVATSANLSGEPVIYRNEDARAGLAPLVDCFLFHDRPIATPVEDSVFRGLTPIRRSRGYAPLPVLPTRTPTTSTTTLETSTTQTLNHDVQHEVFAAGTWHPLVSGGLKQSPQQERAAATLHITSATTPTATATASDSAGDSDSVGAGADPAAGSLPVVVATGGHMKNTVTVVDGQYLFASPHVGEMTSLAARTSWRRAVDTLLSARDVTPQIIVTDRHPDYATTSLGEELGREHACEVVSIQHHLAHALALACEYGITGGTLVVLTIDGTGYGLDGTIWGAEILTLTSSDHPLPQTGTHAPPHGAADTIATPPAQGETTLSLFGFSPTPSPLSIWQRTWHATPFPLIGGDAAVRQPWRIVAGIALQEKLDLSWLLDELAPKDAQHVVAAHYTDGSFVTTTSLGRLVDAAAAILHATARRCGLSGIVAGGGGQTYDGQAACEFEQFAATGKVERTAALSTGVLQQAARAQTPATTLSVLKDYIARLHTIAADKQREPDACRQQLADASRIFLFDIAVVLASALQSITTAAHTQLAGPVHVGISGGAAANHLLCDDIAFIVRCYSASDHPSLHLLEHRIIPCGDGGISIGQAYGATLAMTGSNESV
ncbi:Sua5/YciO/YrdC/YwlC family protein [Corynebacterium choanae]